MGTFDFHISERVMEIARRAARADNHAQEYTDAVAELRAACGDSPTLFVAAMGRASKEVFDEMYPDEDADEDK